MGFTPLLWILFLVLALMYAVYGIVLAYHWVKWSDSVAVTSLAILVYSAVGVVLFGIMISSLVALSL